MRIGISGIEQQYNGDLKGRYKTLDMLQAQPASPLQQSHLATCYHHLGMLAQDRGRPENAEDWYRKSLAISERLGDQSGIATCYQHLGILAQHRGSWRTLGTGTANPSPSTKDSETSPARHPPTTSSATSP